jgi:predicted AAA+ superfamily ATPase
MTMPAYRERAADRLIRDLLNELPTLLLVGPRATGKTTTAMKHVATTVRLDSPGEAVAFRADPDSALRGLKEPILLDEWQAVPEVLGAVKRAVDTDPHPGRFLLTGSVRADLDAETWPGTGRLVRVPLYGMTVAEQKGRARSKPLLDRLARGDDLVVPPHAPDLRGYVELALKSGFPEAALALSDRARAHFVESYLDQLLTRDAPGVAGLRDPTKLRRYFEAYALSSAGLVDDRTLLETAGLNRKTALAYEQLLLNLMVIDRTSPWRTNRLKRLVRSPKRYVTDAALLAASLRLDANGILREGDLLGRLLDTFVASQLRAELPIAECRPRLYHLRQEQGRHEIDLIAEVSATRVIAIEVKASSAPAPDAARHLVWLRDQLGNRFVRGVVLHTGPRAYEIDKGIMAAPIATLWA